MIPSNTSVLGVCPDMHSRRPDMHFRRPVEVAPTKDAFFYQERCLVTVLAVSLGIGMHAYLQLRDLDLIKNLM